MNKQVKDFLVKLQTDISEFVGQMSEESSEKNGPKDELDSHIKLLTDAGLFRFICKKCGQTQWQNFEEAKYPCGICEGELIRQ